MGERDGSAVVVSELELVEGSVPFAGDRLGGLGLRGLHCGSGLTFHDGFLNVDRMRLSGERGGATAPGRLARVAGRHYYLEHDLSQPLPIDDASFDWIHSEHFIEHLDVEVAIAWLGEMRRLLRPGGSMRVSTPDLRRYVAGYLDPSDGFFARHREHLLELGARGVPDRPAWMLNQIFQLWGHRWIYDFDELRTIAGAAGFASEQVTECSFRQGQVPELSALDLPLRSDESLYVELKL